jgi:hypothetical protein
MHDSVMNGSFSPNQIGFTCEERDVRERNAYGRQEKPFDMASRDTHESENPNEWQEMFEIPSQHGNRISSEERCGNEFCWPCLCRCTRPAFIPFCHQRVYCVVSFQNNGRQRKRMNSSFSRLAPYHAVVLRSVVHIFRVIFVTLSRACVSGCSFIRPSLNVGDGNECEISYKRENSWPFTSHCPLCI